jgi:hypothetical protein
MKINQSFLCSLRTDTVSLSVAHFGIVEPKVSWCQGELVMVLLEGSKGCSRSFCSWHRDLCIIVTQLTFVEIN